MCWRLFPAVNFLLLLRLVSDDAVLAATPCLCSCHSPGMRAPVCHPTSMTTLTDPACIACLDRPSLHVSASSVLLSCPVLCFANAHLCPAPCSCLFVVSESGASVWEFHGQGPSVSPCVMF